MAIKKKPAKGGSASGGKKQPDLKETITERYRHKSKAAVWMWSGVVVFTLIIVVLWGWSLKLRAAFLNWNDFKESKLVSQTQADWDKLFAQTQAEELQKELTKIQLKNILAGLTQTAPATTTVQITTTTTSTDN
ncbi:MAG: hypothetical protein AAB678_02190 [Patescibacteria group bacterium]